MLDTTLYCEVSDKDNPRPLLPKQQRDTVVNLLHHADHPSAKETVRRVAQDYYWPGLRKDIENFVRTCHPCQLAKQARTVNPGIGEFKVPDERFSVVHLDIVGPLPKSHDGHRFLLTCFDRTSRWLEAYPLQQASAPEVASAFLQWISRFGVCDRAISDNGNAFIARVFQDIMKNFNIEVTFTPAYHAATNGAIERQHQTIKNSLKAALNHKDQWTRALPWVLLGKRVQYQPFLDASSSQLVLGKNIKMPGQLLKEPGPPLNTVETRALLDQLYMLHDRPGIPTSSKTSKLDISNTNKASHVYVKVDKPESLCPKFEGPYRIHSRPSRSTIQTILGRKKSGKLRLQTYHWSSAKVAHLRESFVEAQRPKLGRPAKDKAAESTLSSDTTSELKSNKNSSVDLRASDRGENAGSNEDCQQTADPPSTHQSKKQPIKARKRFRKQPISEQSADTEKTAKIQTRPNSGRSPTPVPDSDEPDNPTWSPRPGPGNCNFGPVITREMYDQWPGSRPTRSTRNKNPQYVD